LRNIYLRRDIKSVSELYGQRMYNPYALTNQQINEVNTHFHAVKYFLRR
jgi:hypothetical protein